MATSNSSLGQAIASPFVLPVTEKLSKNNLGLWKLQVLPAIRGAMLEGFLDGSTAAPSKEIDVKHGDKTVKEANPEYASWVARDQQVLSYLLSNMTRDVMAQVAMAKTAAELWAAVEEIYSSQSRVRSVNTRIALATTKKGNSTASEYLAKMKSYADEMKDAGRPLDDDEFTSYILTGLDLEDYNPLVSLSSPGSSRSPTLSWSPRSPASKPGWRCNVVAVDLSPLSTQPREDEAASPEEAAVVAVAVAPALEAGVVPTTMVDKSKGTMAGVKSASRRDTVRSTVGIASTKTMSLMKGTSMLPPTPTASTRIGIPIRVPLIT